MKSLISGFVAIAGMAVIASAGTSRLEIQVSKDGTNWSNNVTVNHFNGDTGRVLVRYCMSWIPSVNDTAIPVGFAAVTFQPTFANVRRLDVIEAFASEGTNPNGGGIDLDSTPLNGPFGRLRPFAAFGPAATNAPSNGNRYSVISHTAGSGGAPAGSFYRIARNDMTRWMGTGPTAGAAAYNNFTGTGGIRAAQRGSSDVRPNDPAFNTSIQNVVLMQIAIEVGIVDSGQSHRIDLDVPSAGLHRTSNGLREATWFSGPNDPIGGIRGVISVGIGQINIVPAPSALGLLALGGVVASRRRRCRLI